MIEPAKLIVSADEIDNRMGPIPGRSSDRIARELRAAAVRIEDLQGALSEAERFMAYFANETDGHFSGPGTPTTCLAQIRAVLGDAGPSQEPQDTTDHG